MKTKTKTEYYKKDHMGAQKISVLSQLEIFSFSLYIFGQKNLKWGNYAPALFHNGTRNI